MNVPTKQQLRDEIEQLKEDLYTAMDGLDNKDLFYKLASKNMGYYHWYFEREAEKRIMENPLATKELVWYAPEHTAFIGKATTDLLNYNN